MHSIQLVKFREIEKGFYKIVVRVKSWFEKGVIIMGFTVASGHGSV